MTTQGVSPTTSSSKSSPLKRAWYSASIPDFLGADADTIVGILTRHSHFAVDKTQTDAWLQEIASMKTALSALSGAEAEAIQRGAIHLEFTIPRMGRRIDVVLVAGAVVFAIEFKAGESQFHRSGLEQVWDYALDLKNFHETSHHVAILPLLVATAASKVPSPHFHVDFDKVYHPVKANSAGLTSVIAAALKHVNGPALDAAEWLQGVYRPTPTIVEAARVLYAQHSVESIIRNDAGAKNISVTSARIEELIDRARDEQRKIICFVTGVPGAGKTLVGLNIATHRRDKNAPTHAVFLSGNGPLVAVLREALTRDEHQRQLEQFNKKLNSTKPKKGLIGESVKAFIQNVHNFRDEGLTDEDRPPADHVVIFDEAQRAWNLQRTAKFMRERKKTAGFGMSEPEFLISYMDRHPDWAFIVCLVGGGQEINSGEAGIGTWIEAVTQHFPHWEMVISDKLTDSEYAAAQLHSAAPTSETPERAPQQPALHFDSSLHLSVSMRSFRAENVSSFVKALLDLNLEAAREHFQKLEENYPVCITRDLHRAKEWLRMKARATERCGLLASSKAMRLRPHAIYVSTNNNIVNPVHYFLNEPDDIRSSNFLEDAATEFQVQGLELDWVCVSWDADLRVNRHKSTASENQWAWSYHDFRGSQWQNIKQDDRRRYTLNAYRVLLTRARQGMVIFVPPGDRNDVTRPPHYYDETHALLQGLGVREI